MLMRLLTKPWNCLTYAIGKVLRREARYFIIRWSMNYPGPHFLAGHSLPNGLIQPDHYVPAQPIKRVLPPAIFEGNRLLADRAPAEVMLEDYDELLRRVTGVPL